MVTGENQLAARRSESPINATLLKLIHHELGNGLAVLAGYRHLLQRAISLQASEQRAPEPDVWRRRNEQWLGYLQVMDERQTLLNDFLAQLRDLSSSAMPERLCQDFKQADLREMLAHLIARLAPLFPDKSLRVHLPPEAVLILCDPFWLELTLEHIISHTIAAHTTATPINLSFEPPGYTVPFLKEARLAIQIERALPSLAPGKEEPSEPWAPAVSRDEREICFAICQEVLQEHGGRIWWEQGAGRKEVLCLAMPVPEKPRG